MSETWFGTVRIGSRGRSPLPWQQRDTSVVKEYQENQPSLEVHRVMVALAAPLIRVFVVKRIKLDELREV